MANEIMAVYRGLSLSVMAPNSGRPRPLNTANKETASAAMVVFSLAISVPTGNAIPTAINPDRQPIV